MRMACDSHNRNISKCIIYSRLSIHDYIRNMISANDLIGLKSITGGCCVSAAKVTCAKIVMSCATLSWPVSGIFVLVAAKLQWLSGRAQLLHFKELTNAVLGNARSNRLLV